MHNRITCLLAITCCAMIATACDSGQKRLPAEMTMTQHAMLNGTKDTGTAHKAVVGIYQKGGSYSCGDDMLFCTGTLIHPQWVLTAAHCVTETSDYYPYNVSAASCNKYIKIGVGNTENEIKKNLYDIAGASQIYYHSNYGDRVLSGNSNYGTIDSDIALIKLKTPIPASVAKPILPHPSWLKINSNDLTTQMEFSGFGFDEDGNSGTKLKFTGDVTKYCGPANPSDSTQGCKNGSVTVTGCHPSPDYCSYYGYQYSQREYVLMPYGSIYYAQKTGGPCQGDSGGPAFITKGGVEYVSGITSYGDSICQVYGISTAVQDYYDWILQYAPEVAEQYTEVCDNGIDDNGDGLIDDKDPTCKPAEPICGDGILNNDEPCDGTLFLNGAKKCAKWDESYISGNVYCNADCTINYSSCVKAPFCGDGTVNSTEKCDGTAFLNNRTACSDWDANYAAGNVSCNDDCTINYNACQYPAEVCGDNKDNDFNGLTDCDDPACAKDPACIPPEQKCGNGVVDDDEECDGNAFLLDETSCHEWVPAYVSGTVKCNADCTIDYSTCFLTAAEICDDGVDNNGDNLVDCDDPDCKAMSVCVKAPDNTPSDNDNGSNDDNSDGDNASDGNFPEHSAAVTDKTEICDDQFDNDNNGLADCKDPACFSSSICKLGSIYEICDDNVDNDNNGLVDCVDPACASTATCVVSSTEICGNNIDDDHNGLTDCADPACFSVPACGKKSEICGNNIDDDNNGLTDCEDPACASHATCSTAAPVENCANGIDDDGDGAIDCKDADCKSDYNCRTSGNSICSNGIDDNGNGLIDCKDPVCSDVPECLLENAITGNCHATPIQPSQGSLAALLLGLLGCGALIRRRKQD